ncbi:MAG: hypothetical protein ACFE9Q_08230 [Candidatus Hodarchaeota archaeon]
MVDNHSYSFFGQKVGLIIQSSSKSEPHIYFRLIKCKNDGSWEKPSTGEGKIIKFSLEEMVLILRLLNKEVNSWSSYHIFKDNKTQISFKWEEGENAKLWIHIGSYSKVLEYAQFKILQKLLTHILEEKIEFATVLSNSKKSNPDIVNSIIIQEEIITDGYNNEKIESRREDDESLNKVININGSIRGETDKALLIQFDNGLEVWIPKSTIHSSFDNTKNLIQNFHIDCWILKKHKILS